MEGEWLGRAFVIGATVVLGLLALLSLWVSLRTLRRRRLIENLPTSKVQGVFVGLVELKGTAEAERPLRSHLAAIPCVWYRWEVEERWSREVTETYTDSEGNTQTRTHHESGWTTVARGEKTTDFYLKDDTGAILVRPERAEIEGLRVFDRTCGPSDPLYYGKGPRRAVADSDHVRRFTESAIPLHRRIYLVGHARERKDIVAPEIAYHPDAAMFLISCRSEREVAKGYLRGGWGCGIFGLIAVAAGMLSLQMALDRPPVDLLAYAIAAGAYLLVWCLGWCWMVFNSLINLRQRVRQAWSLVDVQLKRRHDLIPRLVNVVKGLRDHERKVQTQLAELRGQMGVSAPDEAGRDPKACLPLVRAIVERYPELKSDESFLHLQRQLTDTEQRIALARSYYNEIATHYNNRLQTIPDGWIARIGRLKPRRLIQARGFERAEVRVSFAKAEARPGGARVKGGSRPGPAGSSKRDGSSRSGSPGR